MGFKSIVKSIGHDLAHVGLITLAVAASGGVLAPPPFNLIIVAAAGGTQYAISNWHRNNKPVQTTVGL